MLHARPEIRLICTFTNSCSRAGFISSTVGFKEADALAHAVPPSAPCSAAEARVGVQCSLGEARTDHLGGQSSRLPRVGAPAFWDVGLVFQVFRLFKFPGLCSAPMPRIVLDLATLSRDAQGTMTVLFGFLGLEDFLKCAAKAMYR